MKLGYRGSYFIEDFDEDNVGREFYLNYEKSPFKLTCHWRSDDELSDDITDNITEKFVEEAIEADDWTIIDG
jgi:hypothetical protein